MLHGVEKPCAIAYTKLYISAMLNHAGKLYMKRIAFHFLKQLSSKNVEKAF